MLQYFSLDFVSSDPELTIPLLFEFIMYFDEGSNETLDSGLGGYSAFYCTKAHDTETLEYDASTAIFQTLLLLDSKNGANRSRIVRQVCKSSAFKILQVCLLFYSYLFYNYVAGPKECGT